MPTNFEIAYPWVFLLLPIPLLVYWFAPALKIRSASLILPTFQKALGYTGEKPKKSALIKRRGWMGWIILMVSWILLVGALSSPQLVGKPVMKVKTSRNFLILNDISFSMATKDWEINGQKARRWDAVKEVMHDFIEKRKGDRMGLIFFGSSAYIQAPFTPDLNTVEQLLDEADVGMAGQMTHIGKAIVKGIEMFKRDTIKTKVILLLTDGVDAGTDILPLDAANMAKEDSVTIYTIGIGNPGTRGSDLDEKTLQEIAEMTNGKYFLARDKNNLQEIYSEVDKLEPIEFEEKEPEPEILLYYYPLGAALLLLLISSLFLGIINVIRTHKEGGNAYV